MKPVEIPLMAKSLLKLIVTAFRELHKQELFRMKTDNGTLGKIRFNLHLTNHRDDSSSAINTYFFFKEIVYKP